VADKKKILIIGCSGFIGKNLSKYFLRKNYKVYGTYNNNRPNINKKINLKKIDILKKDQLNKFMKGKDVVINAAAVTSGSKDIVKKPYIHFTDNALINSIAIRSAYENKVKNYICLSCSIMYPHSKIKKREVDLDLNKKIFPKYFGGAWIKIFAEKSCEFFSQFKICKYSVVRHTNIYGPHDKFDLNKSHVLGATINKVSNSKSGKITIWGKGKEKRDFLYIDDLLNGINLILRKQKTFYDCVNLSYGKSVSILSLVKKIILHSKKKIEIKHDLSKPNLNINIAVNSNYAKKKYGWKPSVSIDEGLKKTISWYKNNE
jgi:GDP-L-fucose synthase